MAGASPTGDIVSLWFWCRRTAATSSPASAWSNSPAPVTRSPTTPPPCGRRHQNLYTAADLGFGTVHRDNDFLARKFNDGIQLACDPNYNPEPADYVVPFGSDDWIDHRVLLDLPEPDTVLAFQWAAFVSEDGRQLSETRLGYLGGVGIRVYPRQLLEPTGWRPADEDRTRNCDFCILHNTRQANQPRPVRIDYGDLHARQIIDWKSPTSS